MPKKKRVKYNAGSVYNNKKDVQGVTNLELSLRPQTGSIGARITRGRVSADYNVPITSDRGPSGFISYKTKKGLTFSIGAGEDSYGGSVSTRF